MALSLMSQTMLGAKLAVLQATYLLTSYAMSIMTTYLNSVWKYDITHAAAVVNVYGGAAAIMPLFIRFIVDHYVRNYWMMSLSSCASTVGLFFLAMSTPPVLSMVTGTCSVYESECVGPVQMILFYTSLPLIAVGVSGHFMVDAFKEEALLKPLLESTNKTELPIQRKKKKKKKKSKRKEMRIRLNLYTILVLIPVAAVISLGYIKGWSLRFAIPALCTAVATLVLMTSNSTLHPSKAQGSSLITEEIKKIIRKVPICIFFVLIGVVSAIGDTYFTEQANNLNSKLGPLKLSILVLIVPQNAVKVMLKQRWCADKIPPKIGIVLSMISAILCCTTAALVEARRLGVVKRHDLLDKPDEAIPMSIFLLLPQFLLLGAVTGFSEKSIVRFFTYEVLGWPKIGKIIRCMMTPVRMPSKNHRVQIKMMTPWMQRKNPPVEKKMMRCLWIPWIGQTKESSLEKKRIRRMMTPGAQKIKRMRRRRQKEEYKSQYIEFFVNAVSGLGVVGSVLMVYVVGEIEPSWFRATLNRSHLDYYYWILAAFIVASLVSFCKVTFRPLRSGKDQQQADRGKQVEMAANPLDTEERVEVIVIPSVAGVRDLHGPSLTRSNSARTTPIFESDNTHQTTAHIFSVV